MLNANFLEVREIGFSTVLYGRFPALKINPVRNVGST
jgi:hypothetical protein